MRTFYPAQRFGRAAQNCDAMSLYITFGKSMKTFLALCIILFVPLAYSAEIKRDLPIKNGDYQFQHKYAEHPHLKSIHFLVKIRGSHIAVSNAERSDVFPIGLIEEGTLMFHVGGQEWIISTSPNDIKAKEVGGCSDGPNVVDLIKKIYWTC
jgi:hypothetical protein